MGAKLSIRLFYSLQLWLVIVVSQYWGEFRKLTVIEPLWPVRWMGENLQSFEADLVFSLFILSSFAVALFPNKRLLRGAHFLALLQIVAFVNSFGKISHSYHLYIFVGFFCLLISENGFSPKSRREKLELLGLWTYCKAIVLLSYTLAGYWKVQSALSALLSGHESAFSLDSFSNLVSLYLVETASDSVLSATMIEYSWIGFGVFWIGAVAELLAISTIFLYRAQHYVGALLVSFHLMTSLILGIQFLAQIPLLLVLFFCFEPHRVKGNRDARKAKCQG